MAKEAYYFSHDSNARNDPKIIKLRMKLGMSGYGIFWAIVEMLRDEDGYSMHKDYESIAFALNEQSQTIKSVIEDFELFDISSNKFCSNSLNQRMELMEAKSRNGKKAAKIRWDKEKYADVMQTHSEGIAEVMQIKEKKGNEIKESITINNIEIIDFSRLGAKTFRHMLIQLYSLEDFQFTAGLNEWLVMNTDTEFTNEKHLKRSLNLYLNNNSAALKQIKKERNRVSKILNNNW
jgi:hypothetical protein